MKVPIIQKQRCLFVNTGEILTKILNNSKGKQLKPILYDTSSHQEDIYSVVKKNSIDTIVVEQSQIKKISPDMLQELIGLRLKGIRIYDSEEFYETIHQRIPIVKLQDNRYLSDHIFSIRMKKRYRLLKRTLDMAFALLVAPLALILVLIGGILTFLTSRGGIFFSQTRVGKGGKEFKIYKIRTMVVNNGGFTQANDKRITPVGRFLRLTKIDELPQLYNILRGDMSLIGPRPEIPQYVAQSIRENPYFCLRHMIKPGVSGWAQIHIPKATPEDNLKKLEYDLFYIKRYSWQMDLKILFETAKIVLTLNSH